MRGAKESLSLLEMEMEALQQYVRGLQEWFVQRSDSIIFLPDTSSYTISTFQDDSKFWYLLNLDADCFLSGTCTLLRQQRQLVTVDYSVITKTHSSKVINTKTRY